RTDNPEATIDDLQQFIKDPDFPTGGLVMGFEKDREGLVINNIKHAYATGRGRVLIRAKVEFEETDRGRTQILVTELPYQVNKAVLQERIAELVRDKKIEGIAAMQDESDRKGMRLVIEVNRDAVIRTIRESASREAARPVLMASFALSELQTRAILEMQLGQLANLERQRIVEEYEDIKRRVAYLEDLLENPPKITALVSDELTELKKKFGDPRRTEIVSDFAGEITDEDLVANEKVLITISGRGYVKRMPATTYRAQRRGGRGIIGQVLREEDALRYMVAANARDNILFFTDAGKVYQLKAWQIPSYDRTARGTPVINLINLEAGETVTAILAAPDFENSDFLIFATRRGEVKKSPLKHFSQVRSNGLRAMDLAEGDELLDVKHCRTGDDIILVTERGQSARFGVDVLRTAS